MREIHRANIIGKMSNELIFFYLIKNILIKDFLVTSCNSRLSDSTSCECLASASMAVTVLSMTNGLVGPSDTLELADAGCVESSE